MLTFHFHIFFNIFNNKNSFLLFYYPEIKVDIHSLSAYISNSNP